MEEITGGLLPQELSSLKVEELTPLTPEVISRQAGVTIFFIQDIGIIINVEWPAEALGCMPISPPHTIRI